MIIPTTLRMDKELLSKLQDEAKAKNVSMNKLVVNKLKSYPEIKTILDRMDYLEVSLEEMRPIVEWGKEHINSMWLKEFHKRTGYKNIGGKK